MASETDQFVYQLPVVVVGQSTSAYEVQWSEVVVSFAAAGWVAKARGLHFVVDSEWGPTGRARVLRLSHPVSAVVCEGDPMVPEFVLSAVRCAEAAGMGREDAARHNRERHGLVRWGLTGGAA